MKRVLYLGLHSPIAGKDELLTHLPIIKIVPTPSSDATIQKGLANIPNYTHIIFTSQNAVSLFFDYAREYGTAIQELNSKTHVAVGHKTANKLRHFEMTTIWTATKETAEGIVETLQIHDLKNAVFFWPHSALSRPVIKEWLEKTGISNHSCPFYTTIPNSNFLKPDLSLFDEIVFTSPSTVDAFISFYGTLPKEQTLRGIGPVTLQYLANQ